MFFSPATINRIASAELPALIVLAPLFLFPSAGRLVVLLVVPVFWWCAHRASGSAIPRTPLNLALWVLIATVGISLYATFDVMFSLGKVMGIVWNIVLFWAGVRWISSMDRLRLGVAAFLLAGVGLLTIGLFGTEWPDKLPFLNRVLMYLPRALRGLPGAETGVNPNPLAGSLLLFIPLQASLALDALLNAKRAGVHGRRIRNSTAGYIYLSLFVATTALLVLAQSRAAWTALVIAGVAYTALRLVARWPVRGGTVVAALICITLVAGWLGAGWRGTNALVERRLEIWSRGIEAVRDVPISGLGMNSFRSVMPILYPTFGLPTESDIGHAHNQFLQVALDLGIPGLVAYLAVWLLLAVMLIEAGRRADDTWLCAVIAGLAVGLGAHSTFCIADAIPLGSKLGVLFWLAAVLVVGVYRQTQVYPNFREPPATLRKTSGE